MKDKFKIIRKNSLIIDHVLMPKSCIQQEGKGRTYSCIPYRIFELIISTNHNFCWVLSTINFNVVAAQPGSIETAESYGTRYTANSNSYSLKPSSLFGCADLENYLDFVTTLKKVEKKPFPQPISLEIFSII